jgi:hypothetical protein
LAGVTGCGGAGATEEQRRDPFTAIEQEFEQDSRRGQRAAPRWETVALLRGSAAASREVTISRRAIQWRTRWTCQAGSFRLVVGDSTTEARCPEERTTDFIGTGDRRLHIDASRPWRLVVEQEVDTPLREPPLPGMGAETVEARGGFYGVERTGRGSAELHRLPSGRYALRLEGFATSANTDLFVWASPATRPRSTRMVLEDSHRTVAPLKSTQGDQNYVLPRRVDPKRVRSIVIWCEPVRIVYAAAALQR